MTLEERVARLEQQINTFEVVERRLERVETAVARVEIAVDRLRSDNGAVLERILATLQDMQRRPVAFRWPWEPRS